MTEFPTSRAYLKSDFRLIVWCKACRNPRELSFRSLVDEEKGDVPVLNLKFRCNNCGSRLTNAVVSGSHFGPKSARRYGQACEKIAFLSSFLILASISATSCLISYSVPPIRTTVVVGCLGPRKYLMIPATLTRVGTP